MANSNTQFGQLVLEFFVIFVGVTLAFFVENYRERLNERDAFEQTLDGLVVELRH